MASLVEQFVPTYEDPELTREYFERVFGELDRRLLALEILKQGLEGVLGGATTLAVQKVDEYLAPRITIVNQQLQEMQALYQTLLEAAENLTETLLDEVQPLIDAKLASVDTALQDVASAVSQANTARDTANAAATSANAAAASITDVRRGTATIITADTLAVVGGRYKANSSGGAIVVTLPAAPLEGEHVTVWREGVNAVTIARNGQTIETLAENLTLNVNKKGVHLTYVFGTWKAYPAEVL